MEGRSMADNKTNNPDQERNLGSKTGNEGQQAPGRNLNDEKSTGQRGDRGIEPKGRDLNKESGGRGSESKENPENP
jgi:hypothetical protein